MIANDRHSDNDHKELIARLVQMMVAVNFYNLFESGYLSDTREYYRSVADRAFFELNVSRYWAKPFLTVAYIIHHLRRKTIQ